VTNKSSDSRPIGNASVFLFFSTAQFLKTILASRTNGACSFAPTHKAYPSAKPKEPLFSQRIFNKNKLDTNNMLKNMFNILHLRKVEFISLTH
jgi:hypothetical protein